MDSRAPAVNPVIRADVGAALLTSASLRRFLLCVTFALACYYANGVLYNDCDMNEPGDFANLRYGVLTARRGGLTRGNCPNTWDAPKLHAWLRSKRG